MTVQPVELLDEQGARRLTERIRAKALTIGEGISRIKELICQARDGEAWRVLGYDSWPAYLADVLGDQPMRLEQDFRRELVGVMADEGLSVPVIAAAAGVSDRTVQRDFRALEQVVTPVTTCEPDPGPTVYDLRDPSFERIDPATGEVLDAEPYPQLRRAPWPERRDEPVPDPTSATTGGGEAPVVAEPRKVTGLDGKQYTRPAPSAPARRPLRDGFRDAALDLDKIIGRFERLITDDRYPRNRDEVARYANDLTRARDALDRLVGQMSNT